MEYNWDLFKHQIYAFARHYELGLLNETIRSLFFQDCLF